MSSSPAGSALLGQTHIMRWGKPVNSNRLPDLSLAGPEPSPGNQLHREADDNTGGSGKPATTTPEQGLCEVPELQELASMGSNVDNKEPPVAGQTRTIQLPESDQHKVFRDVLGEACFRLTTYCDHNCATCRTGFERFKTTLFGLVGDEIFIKGSLQPMAEEAEEDENYPCAGQGKTLHLCLEDYLDNDVWSRLKSYITDAEENGNGGAATEWATKVYCKLKLRDEEEEGMWQRF